MGETLLYATVYPAIGIIAAPWRLDLPALEAVAGTEAAVLAASLKLSRGGLSWRDCGGRPERARYLHTSPVLTSLRA